MEIWDLELSERLRNILNHEGVKYVSDLAFKDQWASNRNIGTVSWLNLTQELARKLEEATKK